jgi:hypothetical protein
MLLRRSMHFLRASSMHARAFSSQGKPPPKPINPEQEGIDVEEGKGHGGELDTWKYDADEEETKKEAGVKMPGFFYASMGGLVFLMYYV